MKRIDCWNDLTPFGIEILTGEACGLSYRYLCDVTENGRKVLSVAFGIPEFALAEPWNSGPEADRHVGSIMLANSMLAPIGVFALLENGCSEVLLFKSGIMLGIEPADPPDNVKFWEENFKPDLARKFSYRGTAGSRNRHAMSGRIE